MAIIALPLFVFTGFACVLEYTRFSHVHPLVDVQVSHLVPVDARGVLFGVVPSVICGRPAFFLLSSRTGTSG